MSITVNEEDCIHQLEDECCREVVKWINSHNPPDPSPAKVSKFIDAKWPDFSHAMRHNIFIAALVYIQLRDQSRDEALREGADCAGRYLWNHIGTDCDIIAYCLTN